MFLESNLKIRGELYIPIALHLLSKEDNIKSIKKVYSHRQALAQCKTFLLEKIPQAKLVEVESTAKAAELASKEKGAAAVASEIAALEYDLNILEKNIQETSLNYTRFLVLSKKDAENPTGNDKTSIIFSVKHTPGALFKALRPFALYDVNLTKLESRPIKNKPFKYIFFCDFEGHRKDKKIQKLLQELKEEVSYLHILGSYPKADMNVGEENE
ncbi:MAG TPA: ACT domain-containing protein [Aquificae bacterium]|nr:ACT domain-containing protein [Aquificota bacterium]